MMGFVSDHVERALQAAPRGYAWNMADGLAVQSAGLFLAGGAAAAAGAVAGPLSLPAVFDAEDGAGEGCERERAAAVDVLLGSL
jgi:hypothetical protein